MAPIRLKRDTIIDPLKFTMLEDSVVLGVDQSETIYSFIQQLLSNVYSVPDTVVHAGLQGQMKYIHFQPSHQWRRKT